MKLESLKLEKFKSKEISNESAAKIKGGLVNAADTCTGGGFKKVFSNGDVNSNCYVLFTWTSDSTDECGHTTYFGKKNTIVL